MSAVVTGSGINVVRDDFKATSDSLDELLHFLKTARAPRKILVIGRISDYPGRSRAVYTAFAHAAARVADIVVFVGDRPEGLWGGSRRGSPEFLAEFSAAPARVELFATVRDASLFLRSELLAGDLMMLKGSGPSDHLERIVLEHDTSVQCWRAHCGLVVACDSCALLKVPAAPDEALLESR
jgi:UDP-N-acetylmuramoyl-tripeptide--D-alanyl-D-alanine ligase